LAKKCNNCLHNCNIKLIICLIIFVSFFVRFLTGKNHRAKAGGGGGKALF
jgi:hypothetical protein